MTKPLSLLIPAAGKGSRFSDIGVNTPKPLIPILEIPMLLWVIANFPLQPQDKVIVISQSSHTVPTKLNDFLKNVNFAVEFVEIDYWTDGPAHSLEILLSNVAPDSPAHGMFTQFGFTQVPGGGFTYPAGVMAIKMSFAL